MLTSELLVARTYKGKIEPVYAQLSQENLEIADAVLGIFQSHVGRTYGELTGALDNFEGINYRFVRGMAQILQRRCSIEMDCAIDPAGARRIVFEESRGLAIEGERQAAIERAAKRLSVKPDDLEKALWADHEENLTVKEFAGMAPEDLLRQYNLSLAQTLLFKASGMEVQIEDNFQKVFWAMKQLGLMYTVQDGRIYLDGAISIFKLTEKYGTAMAKLLPTIMTATKWSLRASILKKTPQGKRIYDFFLDHTQRRLFGREFEIEAVRRPGFDSSVEKEFYDLGFKGWKVQREPTVLKAGQYAFIPDFSLERKDARIYVEIVGFWTPEYLRNKIQKINSLQEKESLVLLVNKNLACSGSEFQTDNVIFYDKKIPVLEIAKVLRKYEERQLADEITMLKGLEIALDSDTSVIGLDELAGRYGVSLEAIKEVIRKQGNEDYLLLGDQLVRDLVLEEINCELKGVRKHDDALRIFKRYGIKAHTQALESLGYRVKWSGLDPDNAEIHKIKT